MPRRVRPSALVPMMQPPSRETNVSRQELEDALNRRYQGESRGITERDAAVELLERAGPAGAVIPGSMASIRSTQRGKFGFVIRVGIADLPTIEQLVAASNWNVLASVREGFRGAEFASPSGNMAQALVGPNAFHRIPVKGWTFFSRGDAVYCSVANFTSPAGPPYRIAMAITPCEESPFESVEAFETQDSTVAPLPEFCFAWGADVDGGVQLGDTVEVADYSGAVLATYPAREGMVMQTRIRQASCQYISTVGNVRVCWKWFVKK